MSNFLSPFGPPTRTEHKHILKNYDKDSDEYIALNIKQKIWKILDVIDMLINHAPVFNSIVPPRAIAIL